PAKCAVDPLSNRKSDNVMQVFQLRFCKKTPFSALKRAELQLPLGDAQQPEEAQRALLAHLADLAVAPLVDGDGELLIVPVAPEAADYGGGYVVAVDVHALSHRGN